MCKWRACMYCWFVHVHRWRFTYSLVNRVLSKQMPVLLLWLLPTPHYACGINACSPLSGHKKTTKKAYTPTAVVLFFHYFPLTKTSCIMTYGVLRNLIDKFQWSFVSGQLTGSISLCILSLLQLQLFWPCYASSAWHS